MAPSLRRRGSDLDTGTMTAAEPSALAGDVWDDPTSRAPIAAVLLGVALVVRRMITLESAAFSATAIVFGTALGLVFGSVGAQSLVGQFTPVEALRVG